eukprot:g51552.t1
MVLLSIEPFWNSFTFTSFRKHSSLVVTLLIIPEWSVDVLPCLLRHTLTVPAAQQVLFAHFSEHQGGAWLYAGTAQGVHCWDLLSLSLCWSVDVHVVGMALDDAQGWLAVLVAPRSKTRQQQEEKEEKEEKEGKKEGEERAESGKRKKRKQSSKDEEEEEEQKKVGKKGKKKNENEKKKEERSSEKRRSGSGDNQKEEESKKKRKKKKKKEEEEEEEEQDEQEGQEKEKKGKKRSRSKKRGRRGGGKKGETRDSSVAGQPMVKKVKSQEKKRKAQEKKRKGRAQLWLWRTGQQEDRPVAKLGLPQHVDVVNVAGLGKISPLTFASSRPGTNGTDTGGALRLLYLNRYGELISLALPSFPASSSSPLSLSLSLSAAPSGPHALPTGTTLGQLADTGPSLFERLYGAQRNFRLNIHNSAAVYGTTLLTTSGTSSTNLAGEVADGGKGRPDPTFAGPAYLLPPLTALYAEFMRARLGTEAARRTATTSREAAGEAEQQQQQQQQEQEAEAVWKEAPRGMDKAEQEAGRAQDPADALCSAFNNEESGWSGLVLYDSRDFDFEAYCGRLLSPASVEAASTGLPPLFAAPPTTAGSTGPSPAHNGTGEKGRASSPSAEEQDDGPAEGAKEQQQQQPSSKKQKRRSGGSGSSKQSRGNSKQAEEEKEKDKEEDSSKMESKPGQGGPARRDRSGSSKKGKSKRKTSSGASAATS